MATKNRWTIVWAGTALQLCLGTVYAWSYFQNPLTETYHWSNTQVAWVFSLAICFLGLSAAWGGLNLEKFGPRRLAVTGGVLFGAGYLVAALALHLKSLPLLYAGYGVLGGTGLGLGYVTPVATAAKWFPDKKGLVTGMVIMGFGLGALLMSKALAPALMAATGGNLIQVFALLGVVFTVATAGCGAMLHNPPPNYKVAGQAREAAAVADPRAAARSALLSWRFAMMWLVFFCNIVAGISLIGFQSPLIQDLLRRRDPTLAAPALAALGATLIAVSSLLNGAGRFFWGGLSDRIGRTWALRAMLGTQVLVFLLLSRVGHPLIFAILVCYVLLCYGGGFGTMPSFVMDVFGARLMPVVYGAILTAWSAAGIAGPQIVAWLRDHHGAHAAEYAFRIGAGFLAAGTVILMFISDKPHESGRRA
jgi:OFA family oxalate/formate antiporter-like MFS transporter